MIRFRFTHRVKYKKLLAGVLACVLLSAGPGAAAALAGETVSAGEASAMYAEAEGDNGGQGDPAPSQQETAPSQDPAPSQPAPSQPDPAPSQPDPAPAQDPAPSQPDTPSGQDPAPADPSGGEGQTGSGEGTQPSENPGETTDPAGQGEDPAPGTGEEPAQETPAEQEEPVKTEEKKNEPVEDEHELQQAELATGRNEDLFVGMTITSLPVVTVDYRFYHVDCDYSMARFRLYVREDQDDSARVVGTIPVGGLMYVLEDLGDWSYVESGDVRGFARTSSIYNCEETSRKLEEAEKQVGSAEQVLSPLALLVQIREAYVPEFGSICVPPEENSALTFTKATGRATAEKEYAFAREELQIREGMGGDKEAVGKLAKGGVCYILTREKDGYVFVESGDVRGFVKEEALITGSEAVKKAVEGGDFEKAEKLMDPLDNKALFHTILSVKNGDKSSGKRQTLIDLARQCLGHAYIWGGIDPFGYGADCSGFVQTLYKCLGIQLPRVAQDQAFYSGGIKIPVADAAPGDLIFFARNGYIYHVAMCYDNNNGAPTTIEALGRRYGICYYHSAGRDTIWALRILE